MRCAWKELLSVLPLRIRQEVDIFGKEKLQELRLRINAPPELVLGEDSLWLNGNTNREELHFVVNTANRYSPWTAGTMAQGYLTAPGGHRIGICGEVVIHNGTVEGVREISSLCIRIARDYEGFFSENVCLRGSVLILGAPGWGKTTLLRDLARYLAQKENVCVVDERGELFPAGFRLGKKMDVLTGCPKPDGIDRMLRTMGPACLAVDEITAEQDCRALIQAANCGVRLLATAHAASREEFQNRNVYRPLIENSIFQTLLILHKDKSYTAERMTL